MRVAVTGLHHETNTFSPVAADLETFVAAGVLRGQEIVDAHGDSQHTLAGFLEGCRDDGAEIVPLVYANSTPSGMISAEAFETIVGELVGALHQEGPFDVVLLAQHGAAVSAEHPDADGEILRRVRDAVGPDVVIGVAYDLHANVTTRMIKQADVCVGYRENPHRDADVRARECAELALRCARSRVRPAQCLVALPMVVPILGGWTDGPAMRGVMDAAAAVAERAGLLSYSVFHGFGYADVQEMGSSVLTVAASAEVAQAAAAEIAHAFWNRRQELEGEALTAPQAVERAAARAPADGVVVLLDVGDNIGGGSPGDSTVLLAECLAQGLDGVVASVWAPEAVERAVAAGVGAEVELVVGRETPVSVGPEVPLRARVTVLNDGRFEDPNSTHAGTRHYDGGSTALLSTAAGQEIIITSRPMPSHSPEQLRAVGLDPARQRAIIAKGVVAPRAGYEAVTGDFVLVDTPGVTAASLSDFTYDRRSRPLWPLERDAAFDLAAHHG
jgi:microcystin degradation protein MlrC